MSTFDELLGLQPAGSPAESPAAVKVPAAAGGDLMQNDSRHLPGSHGFGGFDGADRHDETLANWVSPLRSADADILPDKGIIDGHTRDMLRNDAYVQGGSNLHKDNIVGAQYMLMTRPASRVVFGQQDDVWEAEFQEEVEEKFDLLADSPNHWLDASRTNTFTQMVRLAVGVHLAGGEVLATVEWVRDGSPFSTAIQFVDLDRLSTEPMSMMDKNVRAGIRYNQRGAPQAYQIRTQHPNDLRWQMDMPSWVEVPMAQAVGSAAGHPPLRADPSGPIARHLRDGRLPARDEVRQASFESVQLQSAVMQSMFAAAITSELPTETVMQQMGGAAMTGQNMQEAIVNYATAFLGRSTNTRATKVASGSTARASRTSSPAPSWR
jgi:hypothetical protein